MQFKEGFIDADGTYQLDMIYQTQWTNNKGPIKLKLAEVTVFAFNEERIDNTPYYFVDENKIENISDTVQYQVDESSIQVSKTAMAEEIFGFTAKRQTVVKPLLGGFGL